MLPFIELVPSLPEELALECLTRLPYTAHHVATRVCRRWQKLLESRDFYYHRKQMGYTHKAACLVQALPVQSGSKTVGPPAYGVSVFDPVTGTWDRVDPVPKYPDGLPLFCQILSSEGKLVIMGGWDPASYNSVKDVFVYEFTTRSWRQGKEMPGKRSFFAAGELNGRVIVAGGHDENKNALDSAWVYDVRRDEWSELPRMSQGRDECEGIVIGSEFWVVSGYGTDSQGSFERSAEWFDFETGGWRRVEDAWVAARCPRSCVGVDKGGRLFCWAECESAVQIGVCGVGLGNSTLVTGSAYQGASQCFFTEEMGKLRKMDVPDIFLGYVQSGCCVEI